MRMGQRLGSRLTVALLAAGVVVAGPGAVGRAVPAAVPPAATAVPAISHAFVIIEENTNFSDVFGARASEAPYLNSLADAHVRHDAYYATSHVSLGNYISMVSGQVPQPLDHFDCPTYAACVRPGPTIGAQLDGAGKTWRGYFETMPAPCTRPTGATDTNQTGYATRHNPFVYFSEIVNDAAYCADRDVPYETSFAPDLSGGSPRNLSFIVPNTCNDGHDAACAGTQTQIQVLDGWLAANVPPILSYVNAHPDSALIITFDEASNSDTSGCCNQLPTAQGGGHVGFVLVAPALERAAGYRSTVAGNHYSLLRTLEDGFGLPPLAEAAKVDPMVDLFHD